MEYERVIIRNIQNSELVDRAALQLHNYYHKNFKSFNVNFVTSGNSHKGYVLKISSNQPIEDDTLGFCLGYAVRVIEECQQLFNMPK